MPGIKGEESLDQADYRALFETSTDLICIFDANKIIQLVNPSFMKRLGYSQEKVLNLPFQGLIHSDHLEKFHEYFSSFSNGDVRSNLEIKCLDSNGEAVWTLWSFTNLTSRNFIFGVARDLTESKRLLLEKEESDRFLKHTVNSLPILVGYLDLDFNYRFMNELYEKLAGKISNNLKSKDLANVLGKKNRQILRENREEAKKTGKSNRCEIDFQNINGEKRFLEVQYHPHRNGNDEVIGIMVLGIDRTDIKLADHSKRKIESNLQRVLSDGKIGFWEYDFASGVISISENIRERMGIPAGSELTQDILQSLIHPDDRELLLDAQKKAALGGKPYEIEFRTLRPDGQYNWTVGTGHPNINECGELIGLVGTTIDVTERKQMEQTLQVQQARMLTSSRLSAIGEMAGGVAHEINNPLTIILSNAQLIKVNARRGNLDSELIEKATGKIEATVMRIAKIIQSLRSLSRDSENDPLEPISLRKILEDTLEICRERFRNHKVNLQVQLPSEDITLHLRPTQISQVLLNLLNNAHDAVENLDSREVQIRLRELEEGVEIAVADSGSGIPEHLHGKIFDPFFTTKAPNKGTGLGLSVSKSIILSHGGSLQINPFSPQTEFVIYLPKNLKSSFQSKKN